MAKGVGDTLLFYKSTCAAPEKLPATLQTNALLELYSRAARRQTILHELARKFLHRHPAARIAKS
jgi:hypothetical protein